METGKTIRIQLLALKNDTEAAGRLRERFDELVEIAREQGAEALLVCPAAEEFIIEGIDLVIGARFGAGLDADGVFWRQHSLADELHHRLKLEALVLDLDMSFDGYVKSVEAMLVTPYRDELGLRL